MAETIWLHHAGLRLAAHFYPPARAPAPGMVICHGFGSRKENHADLAGLLAANGYAVLVPDLRGHGESQGELDGGELDDLLHVLDELAARPEVGQRPIALRGSSMGGRLVLEAATRRERVRAVVAVCPGDPAAFRERLGEPAFADAARAAGVRLDPGALRDHLAAHDLLRTVAALAGRALLLIHAAADEVVPVAFSRMLYGLAGEPKCLLVLPDGHHGSAQHDAAAHAATLAWLGEHLGCRR